MYFQNVFWVSLDKYTEVELHVPSLYLVVVFVFKVCFVWHKYWYSLVSLVDVSSIGLQSQVFWRLMSQVPILKVGVPDVVYEPFTPQGDALFFEFLPNYGLLHWGWGI